MKITLKNPKALISSKTPTPSIFQAPCPLSNAAQKILMQKYISAKLVKEPIENNYVPKSSQECPLKSYSPPPTKPKSFLDYREKIIEKRRQSPVLESIISLMFPTNNVKFSKKERGSLPSLERFRTINSVIPKIRYLKIKKSHRGDNNENDSKNVKVGITGKMLPLLDVKKPTQKVGFKGFMKKDAQKIKRNLDYLLGKLTNTQKYDVPIKFKKMFAHVKATKSCDNLKQKKSKKIHTKKCNEYTETDRKSPRKVEEWIPSPWENPNILCLDSEIENENSENKEKYGNIELENWTKTQDYNEKFE